MFLGAQTPSGDDYPKFKSAILKLARQIRIGLRSTFQNERHVALQVNQHILSLMAPTPSKPPKPVSKSAKKSKWRKVIPGLGSSSHGKKSISSSSRESIRTASLSEDISPQAEVIPHEPVKPVHLPSESPVKITKEPQISPSDTLPMDVPSPVALTGNEPSKPPMMGALPSPATDRGTEHGAVPVEVKHIECEQLPRQPQILEHIAPVEKPKHVHVQPTKKVSYDDSNAVLSGALAGGLVVAIYLGGQQLYNMLTRRQERRMSGRKYSLTENGVSNWELKQR